VEMSLVETTKIPVPQQFYVRLYSQNHQCFLRRLHWDTITRMVR